MRRREILLLGEEFGHGMVGEPPDRRMAIVVGGVVVAALLIVAGMALYIGTRAGRADAGAGTEAASEAGLCGADMSRHPRSQACVPNSEVCTAWLDGSADRSVECTANSLDGQALLIVSLEGDGVAVVRVLDDDVPRHDQRYEFSDSREFELFGSEGPWSLEVTFEEAQGSARITLWG